MKTFRRILVATDFTEASQGAWKKALELARDGGAELFVASAYELPNQAQAEAIAPGVFEEWKTTLKANVVRRLELLVGEAWKSGILAHPLALAGSADEAIVEAVREHGIDLLVLGTHGRRGMSRLFLGSVAARLIATAPCPVMTVRMETPAPLRVEDEERPVVTGF